jgi:tetratricopeptide (TPR) repeat protein
MGRLDEALAYIRQGLELEPLVAPRRNELAMCYNWLKQYDKAIAEARRALELDPTFPLAYAELATAQVQKGLPEEAIAELTDALAHGQRHPRVRGMLGCAFATAGRAAEAQRVLQELKLISEGRFAFALPIARIHAALGEKDQAFEWLRQACAERDSAVIWLKVDPTFDQLRSDPRFDAILQEMRLVDKTAAPTDDPIDTLAVLPFDNQSVDSAAAYLADDITYSLTDSLARVRELKVRPYGSTVRFKAGSAGAIAAGSELQVHTVLRGSVEKRGDDVLIDVELIHVGDDRRLWGERFTGKLAERLALQQQIIQEVPEKLKLALTGQQQQALAKLPTQNLKAHELYTLGRLAWNRRNAADIQKAIEYFEQAIVLDREYALAYAGLADCYVLTEYGRQSPKLAAAKAQTAALTALDLNKTLAGPRYTLAAIQNRTWDFAGAERSFQLALMQEPNYSTGRHWYGFLLSSCGRHDEAISQLQEAAKLDPNSPIIRAALGRTYYMARKFDAAEAEWRSTLTMEPGFVPALAGLGAVYLQQNRYTEAIQILSGIWERDKMFTPVGTWLGYAYGISGDEPRARAVLRKLQDLAKEFYVSPAEVAVIHLGLGEREEALTLLEQGYRDKSENMIRIKVDPIYDSLRDEPRFKKIVADMKFPLEMNR